MKMTLWKKILSTFGIGRSDGACHGGGIHIESTGFRKVSIVGNPNVGKSAVFNSLTGAYVTVSNYPGTTVDVSRGKTKIEGEEYEIVDTPGMYSLLPVTEEERVARSILLAEKPELILQVVDAKNLERMLPLTLQLIEAGFPVIMDLNMMDETEAAGIEIDIERLEEELGVPVVATVATTNRGMDNLRRKLAEYTGTKAMHLKYDDSLESALGKTVSLLKSDYGVSKRTIGLLLIQGDSQIEGQVKERETSEYKSIQEAVSQARSGYSQPLSYVVALSRQQEVKRIMGTAVTSGEKPRKGFAEGLSRAMMNPVTGIPILLAVLYFGMYQFVGVFGAGTMVDLIEGVVFGKWINPWATDLLVSLIPVKVVQDLLIGEFGIITLGLTYAFAIIFPIVGTFFIVFSIIEDSGYLPRLSMLIDRVFKMIGLSGRAVIPMVLGFGCDTMATIVTRTQETGRERVITTLLLALAIPCSAQLGVIFAIMSGNIPALFIWGGVIALVFMLIGYLASRIIPGERASFYMEVPPLRLPRLSNVLIKTYTRLQWYLVEVLPIFVLASILLWVGKLTGVFEVIIRGLEPVIVLIGLPPEATVAFLYGFFRRDFGAAGLYDLNSSGILTGIPLVVAAVTLTLFIPCVAQFSVMLKERGVKTALAITMFVFPFAFFVGFILNLVLTNLQVPL